MSAEAPQQRPESSKNSPLRRLARPFTHGTAQLIDRYSPNTTTDSITDFGERVGTVGSMIVAFSRTPRWQKIGAVIELAANLPDAVDGEHKKIKDAKNPKFDPKAANPGAAKDHTADRKLEGRHAAAIIFREARKGNFTGALMELVEGRRQIEPGNVRALAETKGKVVKELALANPAGSRGGRVWTSFLESWFPEHQLKVSAFATLSSARSIQTRRRVVNNPHAKVEDNPKKREEAQMKIDQTKELAPKLYRLQQSALAAGTLVYLTEKQLAKRKEKKSKAKKAEKKAA